MKKTHLRLYGMFLVLTLLLSTFSLIPTTAHITNNISEQYTFSEDTPFVKTEDKNGIHFFGPTGDTRSEHPDSDPEKIITVDDYLKTKNNDTTGKLPLASVGNTPSLPSYVDNSQSPYFPAIGDQKGIGACGAFAAHYQFTYHINKARGVVTTPENTFSPKWIYNLSNHGRNEGTNYDTVYRLLQSYGAAPLSLVPYDDLEYTNWFAEEGIWKEAMRARLDTYSTFAEVGVTEESTLITSTDDENLLAIKTSLASGDVLTYSTYVNSWNMTNLKTHPDAPENNKFNNEYALKSLTGYNGSHRMALVGYNDNIWVDVNENNQIDEGEMGAFKIVNSWSDGYANNGFAWVAYDAMNDISCVDGMSKEKRARAIEYIVSIKTKPYDCNADAYIEFLATTADRSQLDLYVTAERNGTVTTHKFFWGVGYISDDNRLGFSGTKDSSTGIFTYSLDNIVPDIKASEVSQYSWDVRFVDREDDSSSVKIHSAKVVSEAESIVITSEDEFPFEVNNSEKSVSLGESNLKNAVIYYIGYDSPTLHYKEGDKDWQQVKMEENLERIGHNYKYIIENVSDSISLYFTDDSGNTDNNNGNYYTSDKRLNYFRTTEGDGIKAPLKVNNAEFSNGIPDLNKASSFDIDISGGYEPFNYAFSVLNTTTGKSYEYDYNKLYDNKFYFREEGLYEITVKIMDQTKDVSTFIFEYNVVDMKFIFRSFCATSDEKMFVGNEITFKADSDYEGVYSYAGNRNKYDFVITDENGNTCYTERKNSDRYNFDQRDSTTTLNWTPAFAGKYSITVSSTDISKQYAEKTFEFEVFDKIYGDSDGNNTINIKDATAIQKWVAQLTLTDKFYEEMADCDLSTDINIKDATLVQKYTASFDETEEVGNCIEYIPPVIPTDPYTEPPTETPTEEPTEAPTTPTEPPVVNNTVTFTNSLRWGGTIYCYYWSDSDTGLTSWPGNNMQFVEVNDYGEDIYRFEVPDNANYIIFTNGQSQTVDIPYPGGEMRYYAISTTDSKGAYHINTW